MKISTLFFSIIVLLLGALLFFAFLCFSLLFFSFLKSLCESSHLSTKCFEISSSMQWFKRVRLNSDFRIEKKSKEKKSKAPSSKTIIEKKSVDIFICHIIVVIIILIIITVTALIKTDRYLNFFYQSNSYHFISDDNFQFYQDSTDCAVTKQ